MTFKEAGARGCAPAMWADLAAFWLHPLQTWLQADVSVVGTTRSLPPNLIYIYVNEYHGSGIVSSTVHNKDEVFLNDAVSTEESSFLFAAMVIIVQN